MSDEISNKTPGGKTMALAIQSVNGVMLPTSFKESIEFANVMSRGGIAVPKHLRENAGACLAVIQSAMAWGMDAWLVARKSYAVNDILAFEAQVIAAVVKSKAPIKEKVIPYVYVGDGLKLVCKITLHHSESGEVIEYESPPIGDIKPQNSPLWKSEPRQQLAYHSIRALARRHFPEILLGVYDVEEAYAMRDITPKAEVPNYLNEEEGESVEGEVLPPTNSVTLGAVPLVKDGQPMQAGDLKAGQSYSVDKETGEVTDEPVAPEIIKANLLKYIVYESDAVKLQEWQNLNNAAINELPFAFAAEVRYALTKRHADLEQL